MNELISVILPVYNRQNVIEECIRSLQAQTYPHFEVLVIDDGSTDDTLQICRRLAEADNRIRLLPGAHAGVSAARNRGLDAATGAYVFFIDSDDVIHPHLFAAFMAGLAGTDARVAATQCAPVHQSNWPRVDAHIRAHMDPGETTYLTHEQTLKCLLTLGHSPFNFIGGTMFSAELVGNSRFREDLFIGEDFQFIYENIAKGASAVALKQKWYFNRIHGSNLSQNFDYDAFFSRFRRRELVWKSEEAAGRMEYARLQKRDALYMYLLCLKHTSAYSEDCRKMRQVLRSYKSTLWSAFPAKDKLLYLLGMYLPFTYVTLSKRKRHK